MAWSKVEEAFMMTAANELTQTLLMSAHLSTNLGVYISPGAVIGAATSVVVQTMQELKAMGALKDSNTVEQMADKLCQTLRDQFIENMTILEAEGATKQ